MSKWLYRIGKTAYRKPWPFIAAWLILIGVIVAAIASNGIKMNNETRIDGTEAQAVLDKLAEDFPVASGGQGSFLFAVPEGEQIDDANHINALVGAINSVYALDFVVNPMELLTDSASIGQLQQMQQQLAQLQGTEPSYRALIINGQPIPGVKISANGNIALFQFQLTEQVDDLTDEQREQLMASAFVEGKQADIRVIPAGTLKGTDLPISGINELIGLVVAGIILVVTLGSLIAAGLPLVIALFGVAVGVGGTFALSGLFEINRLTPVLALMIGLAVGIDYALFIVNRQRKLIIEEKLSAEEAAARAMGTAGSAVFFAGLTVMIALSGLFVIGIAFLSGMALVASVTVLIDVLAALTLLPALLRFIGEKIVSAKARTHSPKNDQAKRTFSLRWVGALIRYKWIAVCGIILVLGVVALPAAEMNLGMPSGESANRDTSERQSYDLISENFGEGYNGTLLLVAENRDGTPIDPSQYFQLLLNIQQREDVTEVAPGGFNPDGTIGIISIVPAAGPTDKETEELVHDLRNDPLLSGNTNIVVGITGLTAINIDISKKLAEVFPIYIGIIVVLSLLILLVVFRSVIVPLKATVGFLLSILATFGATTAVFQWGWLGFLFGVDTGGPLLSFIPIMVSGILYGLAMDYQVFLVSSMRESYSHGSKGDQAVATGYSLASKVVVAAALIMVSVFASFIFTEEIMIKQIGFVLAIGILIDAFLIRMMFVPAVMSMFGDKAWWLPKWLDKILPNLDIEGEKLVRELAGSKAAK
jgi:RND superfamily putative drug exporter